MLTVRGWTRIALILIAVSDYLISARGQFCLKTVRCQAHSHRPFGLSLSKPGRALLGPNGFNGAKRISTPAGGDGVGIFEPERFKWVQARSMIIQAVGAGCLLCARCGVPRIDLHRGRVGKVAHVACHHGQAMLQRRHSNQRIECCHGLARGLGLRHFAVRPSDPAFCRSDQLLIPITIKGATASFVKDDLPKECRTRRFDLLGKNL